MDIISDIELLRDEFDGRYKFKNDMLVNQLFGLFDGVLYENIIHNANMAMLPVKLVTRIHKITNMVSSHILAKGGEKADEYSFERVWIP